MFVSDVDFNGYSLPLLIVIKNDQKIIAKFRICRKDFFDLYRIEDTGELEELGMEEAFSSGISLIEWPGRMQNLLPADRPTNCPFAHDDLRTLYMTTIDGHLFRTPTERQGRLLFPSMA